MNTFQITEKHIWNWKKEVLHWFQTYISLWQPAHMQTHFCLLGYFLSMFVGHRLLSLRGLSPKHLVLPCVKQAVPNMSHRAAVNLLVHHSCGSVVLVPRKLRRWYTTSEGLHTGRPNMANAPRLSNWCSQTSSSAITGRVRRPEDLSRFSEPWKVTQQTVMCAFHLTLVGLNV